MDHRPTLLKPEYIVPVRVGACGTTWSYSYQSLVPIQAQVAPGSGPWPATYAATGSTDISVSVIQEGTSFTSCITRSL